MFTCTATGIPLPTISWSSDTGGDITTIAQTMSNMTTIYSEINITNVQMDDFTTYTCTAENQFVSVTAATMLVNASMLLVDVMNTRVDDVLLFSCSNSNYPNVS